MDQKTKNNELKGAESNTELNKFVFFIGINGTRKSITLQEVMQLIHTYIYSYINITNRLLALKHFDLTKNQLRYQFEEMCGFGACVQILLYTY